MKKSAFISRNIKELIRDPLSLIFSIGLPVFLIFMMTFIQKGTKVDLFKIDNLVPGIIVLSLSFVTLFSGMLIASDRSTELLARIFASPLRPKDYIISYTVPLVIMAIIQSVVCIVVALFLGLTFTIKSLLVFVALIPITLTFIGLGIILGIVFLDRQIGAIASIIINIASFTCGMWFPVDIMSESFKNVIYTLPFIHFCELIKASILGNYEDITRPLVVTLIYTVIIFLVAVVTFKNKIKNDSL